MQHYVSSSCPVSGIKGTNTRYHGFKEVYHRHMSLCPLFCRHAKAQNSTSSIHLSLFRWYGHQLRDTQIFNWWLFSLPSLGNSYTRVSKLTAGTIMSFLRPSINGSNSGLKTTELHTNVCLFFWPFLDSLHQPIQKRKLLLHVSTLGRDVLKT